MPINFFINTCLAFFNISCWVFSVLSSVRSPFVLRSFSVRSPFILRSSSVQAPFELRSSSVRAPFGNRRLIEDWLKIDRRTNGESSEAKRRSIETLMGSQGKGDPNKNFIFNHLNSNYYGKTYSKLHHFSAPSHSAHWKSMSYVKGALTKSGEDVISGKQ